jgi:hypothetical protein
MRRRRSGPDDLLVFRDGGGWHDVRSEEVNTYLQAKAGEEFSAKDFRTWHGTVLAAVELAREGPPTSKGGGEQAIRAAIERVAERLGNTPAVCRSSYIDPRVLDRFRDGKTIELPSFAPQETVTPPRAGVDRAPGAGVDRVAPRATCPDSANWPARSAIVEGWQGSGLDFPSSEASSVCCGVLGTRRRCL